MTNYEPVSVCDGEIVSRSEIKGSKTQQMGLKMGTNRKCTWQKGNRNSQEIDVNMADMVLGELIFCGVVQKVKRLRKSNFIHRRYKFLKCW